VEDKLNIFRQFRLQKSLRLFDLKTVWWKSMVFSWSLL